MNQNEKESPKIPGEEYDRAIELYTKAAEQGNASAQCDLGLCYENGKGVPEDINRAIELYTKAAEQGHASAQYRLGLYYEETQDMNKAIELFTKAAEQGHADAQYKLGDLYFYGYEGVTEDLDKAIELYNKASEQGHTEALYFLGNCYLNGDRVPKDLRKAIEFYSKAAQRGYADAKGLIFSRGNVDLEALADALKINNGIKSLHLEENNIGDEGAQAIAEALKVDNCLLYLNINSSSANKIESEGIRAIANGLKINKTLTELDLRGNNIGDTGAQAIAEALKFNKFTDKEMKLTNTSIENIEQALKMKKVLLRLYLTYCKIGNEGLNAIAEMLKVNNSLQVLDILDNEFTDISKLGDALKYNRSLTELVINERESYIIELEKALESNICLLHIKKEYDSQFRSETIQRLLKRNEEIQANLSKRIFECKNRHLSLLDYKILGRVNVAVIFTDIWKLHQTQQTGKTYEECLREYQKLITIGFSKYFLFILGVCKLNQIPPSRSHLLGIPKEILDCIGSFLNPKDFPIDLEETHKAVQDQLMQSKTKILELKKKQLTNKRKRQ